MKSYIAYYRVSTAKQGKSGLGLESQQATVRQFAGMNEIISEYTEIESGKNDKRPELIKALEHAKKTGATLLIAKLDRLSRNASFIFQLRDSSVNFVACDIPEANSLTIGIFALLAQQERELISERTKKALQAKKERGFKLGTPENLTATARDKSIEVRTNKALNNENTTKAIALLSALKNQNLSLRQLATKLNDSGFLTATGKQFQPTTVKRLLDRISEGIKA